ncbi:MAG: hypothetical protein ACI9R3_000544 [Verrucomicrobiales bacterium]|jgi:hypothetical protein
MKNTPTLMKYLAGLAVACGSGISAYAQSEENTDIFDTISQNRINSAWSAEGFTSTSRFQAQEFMTGDHGIVSSVTIRLETRTDGYRRKANGVLHVEVWDDGGGKPGSKVGFLGDVDIPSVKTKSQGGSQLTFDNPIVGLKPNSVHYVVLDYIDSKAFVRTD